MAYLSPDDFRPDAAKSWCRGFTLEEAEISDADLAEVVTEMADLFDQYTGDHFERDVGVAISVVADPSLDAFTATAHGLSDGWTVQVDGTVVPTGLTALTDYFVVGAAANTFQLALTSGGAAVNFSTAGTAVTVTPQTTQLLVNSYGSSHLQVPRRIRSLVAVETRDYLGAYTVEAATAYRYDPFLGTAAQVNSVTTVSIPPGQYLTGGSWPFGLQSVRLTGSFGWNTTPSGVKKAVAEMVWDRARERNNELRRASRYQVSGDVTMEQAFTTPTGLPAVDQVIEQYRREFALVG